MNGDCTIGYNDPVKRVSYTAAHCGRGVKRVYLLDISSEKPQKLISAGTIEMSPNFDQATGFNDWATIHWNDGVTIHPNTFDRDGNVPVRNLRKGQTVCYHGYAQHGTSGGANCGDIIAILGNKILYEADPTQPGDSGGPVYLPGGGLVGVSSAHFAIPDRDGRIHNVNVASAPSDGPVVSKEAQSAAVSRHYGRKVSFSEIEPEPGSALVEGLTEMGSSDPEAFVIALVVIGGLMGALALGDIIGRALM
mgnify:CR=1 FL=1